MFVSFSNCNHSYKSLTLMYLPNHDLSLWKYTDDKRSGRAWKKFWALICLKVNKHGFLRVDLDHVQSRQCLLPSLNMQFQFPLNVWSISFHLLPATGHFQSEKDKTKHVLNSLLYSKAGSATIICMYCLFYNLSITNVFLRICNVDWASAIWW